MEEEKPSFIRKCIVCGTLMIRHNTVKIIGNTARIKVIGYHFFCPNKNCSYEENE